MGRQGGEMTSQPERHGAPLDQGGACGGAMHATCRNAISYRDAIRRGGAAMETSWPGCPEQIWDAVDDDGSDLWVPSPGMLPSWGSPRDLIGKYLVVPAWWQRAVLVIVFLCVAIVAVASGAHRFDWDSYGPFKRVLAVVLVAVIIGG